MVYLSVACGDLCLQIGFSVRWLGVMFGIGFFFVGSWLCDSIITLTLGMVSVLDFFITDLNQSHGF